MGLKALTQGIGVILIFFADIREKIRLTMKLVLPINTLLFILKCLQGKISQELSTHVFLMDFITKRNNLLESISSFL